MDKNRPLTVREHATYTGSFLVVLVALALVGLVGFAVLTWAWRMVF